MNRIDRFFGLATEARVRYRDGEFQVLSPGDYVRCGVTGQNIPLGELKYWNVAQQEAYASAEIAVQRYKELAGQADKKD